MKRVSNRSVDNRTFFSVITGMLIGMMMAIMVILLLSASSKKVYALPEYSQRTGEPCAACHVSAGGGGPRTLRGLLWSARGKPDKVPSLPGILLAPQVSDGAELYQVACSGCHGRKGEGLSAMGLANTMIRRRSIEVFTLHGIPKLGMPNFEGQFTESQVDRLVDYVAGLASGEIPPPADSYPLPPALIRCPPGSTDPGCAILHTDNGGN